MLKSIKAIFFCLLSMALSFFCIGGVLVSKNFKNVQLEATDNPLLDGIIDRVVAYNTMLPMRLLIAIGLLALLFELLFSKSMNEFFSKLPLGGYDKFDGIYGGGFKGIMKHSISVLSPALICSVFMMILMLFGYIFPNQKIETFCYKWILPVTLLLMIIALIAVLVSVIKYGGLWGVLVRLPLLISANVCFCCIGGLIIIITVTSLITISVGLCFIALMALLAIILIPIILFALMH